MRALAAEGFDPGAADGLIGTKTRAALRGWQKARGLTADGYLSMAMIERLKAEIQPPASEPAAAPPVLPIPPVEPAAEGTGATAAAPARATTPLIGH